MDKKMIAAFVLSFLIIALYPIYLQSITKESTQERIDVVKDEAPERPSLASDQKIPEKEITKKTQTYWLQSNVLEIEFSESNAAIVSVNLKEYVKKSGLPSTIISNKDSILNSLGSMRIMNPQGDVLLDDKSLLYKYLDDGDENTIVFESNPHQGLVVRKKYGFAEGQYGIDLSIEVENATSNAKDFYVEIESGIDYDAEGRFERQMVNGTIKGVEKTEVAKIGKLLKEGYHIRAALDWVALERKYFTVIIKPFFNANEGRLIAINDNKLSSYVYSEMSTVQPKTTQKFKSLFYAGPTKYENLTAYEHDFEDLIGRGFFGALKKYTLITLLFFNSIVHNYGIAIILLTVLIKILFTPLTHKSFESMRKMQELQPQMKALQEKYKDRPQDLNREVMELYRKHKANPFGGCFPILLQMPIFIALYQTLSRSVELKGAPFIWWITDLSEPDRLFTLPFSLPVVGDAVNVLPILMIGSMVLQQKLTPTAASKDQERMMLIMPIVFGVIFYNLPSGLVLYWFVNNILTIAHQTIHRKSR